MTADLSKVTAEVQKLAYGTGYWTGQMFFVPYLDGLMDSIEPVVKKRILRMMPNWINRLMESVFE